MNRREMLLENFKFIFSFLVRTCSPPELEKALGYVQVRINFISTVYYSEKRIVYSEKRIVLHSHVTRTPF